MRVEKEVTKLTKMHTEMRITVSIALDIKQMLHKRENIATKKTRVKHYIYFAFSLNWYFRVKNQFFSLVLLQGFFFIPGYHNNRVRVSDIIWQAD